MVPCTRLVKTNQERGELRGPEITELTRIVTHIKLVDDGCVQLMVEGICEDKSHNPAAMLHLVTRPGGFMVWDIGPDTLFDDID